jgi:hypothetical protein
MATKQAFGAFGYASVLILLLLFGTMSLETVPPIWWDEGWNFTIARNWVEKGYYGRLLVEAPIPISPTNGFPVIASVALGFKLFGIGIWQGRILFPILSFGTLALIYHLAACLYGRAVGLGTLFVLTLMSAYPGLHPIVMGRQALGDIPAMFYLLMGYECFVTAEKNTLWIVPAMLFWAIAIVTKLQVLPFWVASLLVPLAVSLFQKSWRMAGLIALATSGAVITSRLLLWFLEVILNNPTLPNAQLRDLYQVTALVTAMPARFFSLIVTLQFGIPALLGISYGVCKCIKGRARFIGKTAMHTEYVRLALLVLASSWLGWYLTLSVGWARYLLPATLVGSIFASAMLYDLTGGFSLSFTLQRSLSVIKQLRQIQKGFGTLSVVVLVGVTVPQTLLMLHKTYVLDADASVQEVAHFINTQTPSDALVETYDSELFFLLRRPYHYPPDQLHVDLVRRTFLYDENVPMDYDALRADPDYLIVGPHSKQWRLYDNVLSTGAFRLRRAYKRYDVHERVR